MSSKTYSESLEELSDAEILNGLVGKGLFSEAIPPFLTSEDFLRYANEANIGNTKIPISGYINYDSIRHINIPRPLAIPNPFAYYNLCYVLSSNWRNLREYFKKQTQEDKHKVSRIHIRSMKSHIDTDALMDLLNECDNKTLNKDGTILAVDSVQKIFDMSYIDGNYGDCPEPALKVGKRLLVKADISKCFASIYTHAIPWAIIGKEKAKENLRKTSKLRPDDYIWSDAIDIAVRGTNNNETHGILIGPHAYNVVSEILLTAIDFNLHNKYKYIRHIDNYTFYANDHNDADMFLIDLSCELKKLNLSLNHSKTEIIKLPVMSEPKWVVALKSFIFKDTEITLTEIKLFLDIALNEMSENKENSAILNYAIKKICSEAIANKRTMESKASEYLINTIHHLILLYPYLIKIIDKEIFENFVVKQEKKQQISKLIYEYGYKAKAYEAMCYAIYFALKYGFTVDDGCLFEKTNESNDAILLLLAYCYDRKFNNTEDVIKNYQDLAKKLSNEFDQYWLFIYESLEHKELQSYLSVDVKKGSDEHKPNDVKQSQIKEQWLNMKKKRISFIKPKLNHGKDIQN